MELERIGPLSAEEMALRALGDWINVNQLPNRSRPDRISLRIQGQASTHFRAQVTKLLNQAQYESVEFREETSHTNFLTYLEAHRVHCQHRQTA